MDGHAAGHGARHDLVRPDAGTVETWTIVTTIDITTMTNVDDALCVRARSGHGLLQRRQFTTSTVTSPSRACVDIPITRIRLIKHVDNSAL